MCMVALGVIQQYYIYLKTAIFFNKKVVTLLYLWLAAALAAWYNHLCKKWFIILIIDIPHHYCSKLLFFIFSCIAFS